MGSDAHNKMKLMTNKEMPATEAGKELQSYELAFHVLPTVAEGEVANVFQSLKDIITKNGGSLTSEEAPARFDLAYEVIKYLEGRNRKFTSAYFGWIRFTVDSSAIESISDEVSSVSELLRHLLIKLNKHEEANPFFFHEALEKSGKVKNIDLDEEDSSEESEEETPAETPEDSSEDKEEGEESEAKA